MQEKPASQLIAEGTKTLPSNVVMHDKQQHLSADSLQPAHVKVEDQERTQADLQASEVGANLQGEPGDGQATNEEGEMGRSESCVQEQQQEHQQEHQEECQQGSEQQPTAEEAEQEQAHSDEHIATVLLLESGQSAYYPPYDPCSTTKIYCAIATAMGATAAVACLTYGAIILHKYEEDVGLIDYTTTSNPGERYAFTSAIWPETASFAINMVLTLCIEGMMFTHAVSLRWALYDEGSLEYNTNLRLFTSSQKFGPNRWYVNVLTMFCLILTYAASSAMFPLDMLGNSGKLNNYGTGPNVDGRVGVFHVNGAAVVALGVGLAGQAAVASWCLLISSRNIPTWGSNPLNVTLAALHHGQFTHRPNRCMLSVHQQHQRSDLPVFPSRRQRSIYQAKPSVRLILGLLWVLAILAVAWAVAILILRGSLVPRVKLGFSWAADASNSLQLQFSPAQYYNPSGVVYSTATQAVLCVLFIGLVQGLQTVGIHCTELLVNVSRDESAWRRTCAAEHTSAKGARLQTSPIAAAISSWENSVLFIAKALLHWIAGQAMTPAITTVQVHQQPGSPTDGGLNKNSKFMYEFDVAFTYPRLFIYSVLAILLAVFSTFLAFQERDGCIPATMGHLPTLSNLIDDWSTDDEGRMWWGDKTPKSRTEGASAATSSFVVRHAGTSSNKASLGPIREDCAYAG